MRCKDCKFWVEKDEDEKKHLTEELEHGSEEDKASAKFNLLYGKCLKSIHFLDVVYEDIANWPKMVSFDASGYVGFLETHKDHSCGEFEPIDERSQEEKEVKPK